MEFIGQGDIFWVDAEIPEGSEPGYTRPVVVIQNNVFNKSRINTVVVCTITSNLKLAHAPGNVFLKKGEGGLPKDSVVNISQIITVDKAFLVEKAGSLPAEKTARIINGVKLLIEPRSIST